MNASFAAVTLVAFLGGLSSAIPQGAKPVLAFLQSAIAALRHRHPNFPHLSLSSEWRFSVAQCEFARDTLAKSPKATLYTKGSDGFITSTAALIATGRSEPVPGWDFHLLWTSAFSRRTRKLG